MGRAMVISHDSSASFCVVPADIPMGRAMVISPDCVVRPLDCRDARRRRAAKKIRIFSRFWSTLPPPYTKGEGGVGGVSPDEKKI